MTMQLPLEGIEVLEIGQILAAPYCTMLLGDMGARVIKVEPPGGEQMRQRPPMARGHGAVFLTLNRNKESVTLNLRDPRGLALCRELARRADVLVQNLKPGTAEKLGLGYEELSAANPRLIYCAISGYGPVGPLWDRPAMELALQAFSGLMDVTGENDGPPLRTGASVVDVSSAMNAAIGVLVALVARQRTGRGQRVDSSMFKSAMALLLPQLAVYNATGETPQRWGSGHAVEVPYQVFPAKDGDIVVAAGNNAHFTELCHIMGLEHLLADERYRTIESRVAHRPELVGTLTAEFRKRTVADWLALFEPAGLMCNKVNTLAEAVHHPQAEAVGLMVQTPHPGGGSFPALSFPVGLSAVESTVRSPAPLPGQHTDRVLAELGYSPEQVAELRRAGAVG